MPNRDQIAANGGENEKAALLLYDGMQAIAQALVEAAKIMRGRGAI